jgi:Ca2+-binding RTX toxin-like protein
MKWAVSARTIRSTVLAALLTLFGVAERLAVGQATVDPARNLTIGGTRDIAVLTFFGENGVSYQLETSPDLIIWTNLGPVRVGSGSVVNVPVSIVGQSQGFFRLRRLPKVTAIFDPGTGTLDIVGDLLDNTIVVSRDAVGKVLVNGGAIAVSGGVPTVANTVLIQVSGKAGNDQITLEESNGALPRANLSGEEGSDMLTGGSGADILNGGPGNDTLVGRGGADTLFGGADNDTLIGGDADDQVFGDAGNDRMVWNPGDDTDVNEGGTESDTVEVNGGNGAEVFTTTANGTRVRFDRLDPAPFALDIGTSENLVVNANGGNDSFSATGNLAALIQITVDGGAGEDTLLGSNGADVLIGGDNNDFIDGQQGNDVALMGAGDDTFQWDPGDGSDTLEGQDGNDRLLFNGSNTGEIFEVSANGARVRFTRNVGNIAMDLNDVETLEVNALGGIDIFTINDLAGTNLTSVIADLAATGGVGDAQADVVSMNGTAADDLITATLPAGDLLVTGLAASVLVDGFETIDTVRIQGLAGEDVIDAAAVGAGGPLLVLDGGVGHDILLGGAGGDHLIGGDDDDVLLGNGGADVLEGNAGDNILIQDGGNVGTGIVTIFGDALDNTITISRDAAGVILHNGVPLAGATIANTSLIRIFGRDGNDTLTISEVNGALPATVLVGGAGNDTLSGGSGADMLFGGSNDDALIGRGGADLLFGGSGNDTLTGGDADDQAFGQGDNDRMVWNPGDDTDLNEGGVGVDTVEVNGGNGAEVFTTTANGTRVRFDRLDPAPFSIDIGTSENLVVNANGGNDSFSATGNLAALIQITVDGGAGEDTLLGSNGADVLIGGDNNDFIDGQQGNDVALMGAGDDTFQWDPGDGSDTLEGQDGNDRLLFNGSNIGEIFEVSANGARVRFTRNVANITMDLNDVENLDLNTLGVADVLSVNDLTGTDLVSVDVDLAGTIGGGLGDGQPDVVTVNGTSNPDAIFITANGGVVNVSGLPAAVGISRSEVANDDLIVNGLGGVDTFTTGAGVTALIEVTVNQ